MDLGMRSWCLVLGVGTVLACLVPPGEPGLSFGLDGGGLLIPDLRHLGFDFVVASDELPVSFQEMIALLPEAPGLVITTALNRWQGAARVADELGKLMLSETVGAAQVGKVLAEVGAHGGNVSGARRLWLAGAHDTLPRL